MTFSEVLIKRMNGLIETANKDSSWEMEAVAEMMKAVHLLGTLTDAQSSLHCGEMRKTLSEIKALALNVKPDEVRDGLTRIVRLCIDAGSAPPDRRNWTEDVSRENGNYECRCCECDQTFIGHKRRVICKACSNLLTPSVPSTTLGGAAS